MDDVRSEIKRVEAAIAKTNSKYLKRDYEKRLKKLRKRMKWG